MRLSAILVAMLTVSFATSSYAFAMGPSNPEPGDHFIYVGVLADGQGQTKIYVDRSQGDIRMPDSSVISTVALVYATEQHASQGAYYQELITVQVWCNDKTYDPKQTVTYLDQNGKFLFIVPDRETVVHPKPIQPNSIADAVYHAQCP